MVKLSDDAEITETSELPDGQVDEPQHLPELPEIPDETHIKLGRWAEAHGEDPTAVILAAGSSTPTELFEAHNRYRNRLTQIITEALGKSKAKQAKARDGLHLGSNG